MTAELPPLTILTDDAAAVVDTLAELALAPVTPTPATERRGIELLGPIVQFVLPSIASFALAARTVVSLARKFRSGTIIDTDEDGGLVVRRDRDLPRGMVVVRRGGETIDVLDVAEDGTLERLTDLLKKGSS